MHKVMPQFYNGEEVVQLSRLPVWQAKSLQNFLSASSYRTIQVGDILLKDCVLYDEYEYWFEYCNANIQPELADF